MEDRIPFTIAFTNQELYDFICDAIPEDITSDTTAHFFTGDEGDIYADVDIYGDGRVIRYFELLLFKRHRGLGRYYWDFEFSEV